MMQAFDSVSEGCFVIRPANKAQLSKARKEELSHYSYDGFRQLIGNREAPELVQYRHRLYTEAWAQTAVAIERALAGVHAASLDCILAALHRLRTPPASTAHRALTTPYRELPALSLYAGVNIQDHDALYAQVTDRLATEHRTLAVRLHSRDCSSIKVAMTRVIRDTLRAGEGLTGGTDDLAEHQRLAKRDGFHAPPAYDVRYLVAWYRHLMAAHADDLVPGLTIIFQDFEGFPKSVLEAMIQVFSEHQEALPVTFVFGIATSADMVRQALSKRVTGLLQVESLNLQLAAESVNALVEQVVIPAPWGLALGYEAYKYLLDEFFLHNFSLTALTATLQYTLMDFYYSNPLSVLSPWLALEPSSSEMGAATPMDPGRLASLLGDDHLEILRMQPSVRDHLEGQGLPATELRRALNDDAYFLSAHVQPLVQRLRLYRRNYTRAHRCFQTLQNLSDTPHLRKAPRIVHLFNLNEDLYQTKHYTLVMQAFKRTDVANVTTFLTACLDEFNETETLDHDRLPMLNLAMRAIVQGLANEPKLAIDTVRAVLQSTTALSSADLQRLQTEGHVVQKGEDDASETTLAEETTSDTLRRGPSRNALMQSLLTGTNRSAGGGAPTTPQRINRRLLTLPDQAQALSDAQIAWLQLAYEAIEQLFRLTTRCYDRLPLHELFYYSNDRLLKRAFSPQPRASIQTALGQPNVYIRCRCCADHQESDAIHHTHDDTCVLYKLYLECGRLINLYDWFMAFSSIKEAEAHRPSPKELQARFVRGISDLQFLGFIKPTMRKTDHVIRLTWGSG
ncbi:Origin recognition complex subunit 3 [Tieghemiomyces parasiticus]|uniref:Origin recognition complex subunit 3 n=1 Tax=Tieghemiomyces parasiticus TaxID=78921 RepID=A0A9W8A8A0_9FUNG|nr:Origin recognition complex subunit 3 [Tieghemiomyces parasiticus]